jgi:multidrug efflux pump subunit AcrB
MSKASWRVRPVFGDKRMNTANKRHPYRRIANKLQERGRDKMPAIREAAMTRLRPVLMTSVASVAGHFPLTLVDDPGATARNSIGLVLVGGMTIGTIFTLFVVPSLYMMAKQQRCALLSRR